MYGALSTPTHWDNWPFMFPTLHLPCRVFSLAFPIGIAYSVLSLLLSTSETAFPV